MSPTHGDIDRGTRNSDSTVDVNSFTLIFSVGMIPPKVVYLFWANANVTRSTAMEGKVAKK